MARRELNTADIKIEQKPNINLDTADTSPDRRPEIVKGDGAMSSKDFNEVAFNEEPVTIRISSSPEKNAPHAYYCAVNGKGAEVMIDGRWRELSWLPVGQTLTLKRKYVEVLMRAKTDNIETVMPNVTDEHMQNSFKRVTTSACTFSILRDANPRSAEWVERQMRQNF